MYMLFSLVALALGLAAAAAAFNAVGGGFFGFVAAVVAFIVTGWVVYIGGGLLASAMTGNLPQRTTGATEDEVGDADASLRASPEAVRTQTENERRVAGMVAQQTPETLAMKTPVESSGHEPCIEDRWIGGDYSPPEECGEVTVTGTVMGTITVSKGQEVRLQGEAGSIVVNGGKAVIGSSGVVNDIVFNSGELLVRGATVRGEIRSDLFTKSDFFRVPSGYVYAPNGPTSSPYVFIADVQGIRPPIRF